MLHPSYTDLMAVVNSDVEPGEQPVVQSRYSIVLATAKRARQLISGHEPLVKTKGKEIKALSIAVEELYDSKIKILNEEDAEEDELEVTVLEEEAVLETEEASEDTASADETEESSVDVSAEEVSEDAAVEKTSEILPKEAEGTEE